MRAALLATGTTEMIVPPGPDEIGLVETLIGIAPGVVLRVINGEIANLDFGNYQHVEMRFTEELAAAFLSIEAIKPADMLASIALYSVVSI